MKILPIVALLFVFTACERNNNEPSARALEGRWDWVQSQGGIAGMTYKASENDSRQLIFSKDGDFELFQNGKSLVKSKYLLKDSLSINFEGVVPMIHLLSNSSPFQRHAFTIKKNTLLLYDEYNDGFTHTYVKVR